MRDYAVQDEEEIAARFPIPNDDLADRLVNLLLPREPNQLTAEEIA